MDLNELIRQEIEYPNQTLSPALQKELIKKHFVFVDGIMNGFAYLGGLLEGLFTLGNLSGSYFADNIEELKNYGFSVSHLGFYSSQPVPVNGIQLANTLEQIYQQFQKPIILIGHSKGGAESLYSVLKRPQLLIDDRIEKVILIQPAIGGTILAEKLKSNYRASLLKTYLGDGLKSLSPTQADTNFKKVYAHFWGYLVRRFVTFGQERIKQEFLNASQKVSYIRSFVSDEYPLSLGVRLVRSFCVDPLLDQGDGLLSLNAQQLNLSPAFGTQTSIEADHVELVVSGMFSNGTPEKRKAFTRALLKSVFHQIDF